MFVRLLLSFLRFMGWERETLLACRKRGVVLELSSGSLQLFICRVKEALVRFSSGSLHMALRTGMEFPHWPLAHPGRLRSVGRVWRARCTAPASRPCSRAAAAPVGRLARRALRTERSLGRPPGHPKHVPAFQLISNVSFPHADPKSGSRAAPRPHAGSHLSGRRSRPTKNPPVTRHPGRSAGRSSGQPSTNGQRADAVHWQCLT